MKAEFDVKVGKEYDGIHWYITVNGIRSKVRAKEKHVANVYTSVIKLAIPTIAKAFSVAMKGE